MDKFNNFSESFAQRRSTQAQEGQGESETPTKGKASAVDLSSTFTNMQSNYEVME